jgi:hypothetical protein
LVGEIIVMKLNEEQLKELYQQNAGRAAQNADCLQEDLLQRAAARELSDKERLRVVAHLRGCADCSRNYRIAHATKQWAAENSPLPAGDASEWQPVKDSAAQLWWRQLLQGLGGRTAGFAAVALLIIVGSFIAWRLTRFTGPTIPAERGSSTVKLTTVPPDKALLEEVPAQLSWLTVEAAESYQVSLYDFELTSIWESRETSATSLQLPDQVRAKLPRGQIIYWRVSFLVGIERRQSELFQFTLKAPAN